MKFLAIQGPLCWWVCEAEEGGGGEKYDNFSNISWGITSDYRQLFMELYTSIKQITKGWFIKCMISKKLLLPTCISGAFN